MTFADFIRSHGIIPPEDFTPGKWQRVSSATHPKKKNCNVKLGDGGNIGFAIDFATMTEAATWRSGEENKIERAGIDNAALSARIAERQAEEKRGTMRAAAAYEAAQPLLGARHAYLERKRMTMEGCRGVRVNHEGWLVIPVMRDGRVISIQRIAADGEKRFATGAPTKGGTFRIWRPGASVQILVEGFATGLVVFSAIPQAQVIVCFSAANLIAVAEREEWAGMVAIAADNDHWTQEIYGKNPGKEAGERAAAIIGCGVAFPQCDGTDFDDQFRERLETLEKEEAEKPFPLPPGKLRQRALTMVRARIWPMLRNVSSTTP